MTLYYEDERVRLYLGDAREVLPEVPAKRAVLVTDPPYGINLDTAQAKSKTGIVHRPVHDDDREFDPAWLLERFDRAVIFGGNNFASRLPDSGDWIVWDKVTRNGLKMRIAEYELAWSRGVTGRTVGLRHMWSGAFRASERGTSFHPCQKPVALMDWILSLPGVKAGDVIVDPYAGSGATLLAARNAGMEAVGAEIDEAYAEVIAKRMSAQTLALDLVAEPVEVPLDLGLETEKLK